jgi:hypothetical protein
MVEKYENRVHTEHVVLDIGQDIGSLVIYTREELRGYQIDVSLKGNASAKRVHTDVLERRVRGASVFAAVFAALPEGEYVTWSDPAQAFTVVGGHISELDWRNTDIYVPPVSSADIEGRTATDTSQSMFSSSASSALSTMLPPRYQGDKKVSAAPMGTAPMRYRENGQVAWDEMWVGFCDLALAGGPPHRDTLLEPVPPDEVRANMAAYERVLAEIERGLRLITGLPVLRGERPGWIGLRCESEEMALWLLRAIIVENVCVRREGSILFLPVGPDFRMEQEIKNVITVVAKTHHYWMEHINDIS